MNSTDNWAKSMVALGAKGAVLTVKHDSGFLLWKTNTTLPDGTPYNYSVGHSAQNTFQRNVAADFVDSMARFGLSKSSAWLGYFVVLISPYSTRSWLLLQRGK